MFSRIRSAVVSGIEGCEVSVETDIANGLPSVCIVGLASTMVMESRERIKSAIVNSGFDFPHSKITVNLTPASVRKSGSCLDLAISIGILTSTEAVNARRAEEYGIVGELALDGTVLGIDGLLPIMMSMRESGLRKLIVPRVNANEARLVSGVEIHLVSKLDECVRLINGESLDEESLVVEAAAEHERCEAGNSENCDFADISGQETAKRAVVIAATGRHGLLMIGTPGCGKTMIAKRIPTIMPKMTEDEMIETAMIYSVTGRNYVSSRREALVIDRPFRNPHHTIGRAGLIGGGLYPVPGEITLAHNGVLFLDEACEFDRDKIESLRLPIEERKITHSRRGEAFVFPCNFQLVMASNPCPCGYFGDPERLCKCTEAQLMRYRKRLSGPIVDRIDMRINMEKVSYNDMRRNEKGSSSLEMRHQVEEGIRFARESGRTGYNAELSDRELERYCGFGETEERFMQKAYSTLKMSPRTYKRTLKVARTIADLDKNNEIQLIHLTEALSYRMEDVEH